MKRYPLTFAQRLMLLWMGALAGLNVALYIWAGHRWYSALAAIFIGGLTVATWLIQRDIQKTRLETDKLRASRPSLRWTEPV